MQMSLLSVTGYKEIQGIQTNKITVKDGFGFGFVCIFRGVNSAVKD